MCWNLLMCINYSSNQDPTIYLKENGVSSVNSERTRSRNCIQNVETHPLCSLAMQRLSWMSLYSTDSCPAPGSLWGFGSGVCCLLLRLCCLRAFKPEIAQHFRSQPATSRLFQHADVSYPPALLFTSRWTHQLRSAFGKTVRSYVHTVGATHG